MSDPINPEHYDSDLVWPLAELLGFNRGNAVKYIARTGRKDPTKYIEDLDKAIRYLEREKEQHTEELRKTRTAEFSKVMNGIIAEMLDPENFIYRKGRLPRFKKRGKK